jgi:hypothetical protein
VVVLALLGSLHQAAAQGTAFDYLGILDDSGGLAAGVYDFTFSLSSSSNEVVQVGATITNFAVPVADGMFTVTLDFGAGVFTGNPLWVEIGVRTNGAASFSPLNPLQPILPVPYAVMAGAASNLLGTLPASQLTGILSTAQLSGAVVTNNETNVTLSGAFSGNGAGLTNLNAANSGLATTTQLTATSNGILTVATNAFEAANSNLGNIAGKWTINTAGQVTNTSLVIFTNTFSSLIITSNGWFWVGTNGNTAYASNGVLGASSSQSSGSGVATLTAANGLNIVSTGGTTNTNSPFYLGGGQVLPLVPGGNMAFTTNGSAPNQTLTLAASGSTGVSSVDGLAGAVTGVVTNNNAGSVNLTNMANLLAGNGAGLTNLQASNIVAGGAIPAAALPAISSFSGTLAQSQLPGDAVTNNNAFAVSLANSFTLGGGQVYPITPGANITFTTNGSAPNQTIAIASSGGSGGGAQTPLTGNVNGANYGITNLLDIILGNSFTLTTNGFTNTANGSTAYLMGPNSSLTASNETVNGALTINGNNTLTTGLVIGSTGTGFRITSDPTRVNTCPVAIVQPIVTNSQMIVDVQPSTAAGALSTNSILDNGTPYNKIDIVNQNLGPYAAGAAGNTNNWSALMLGITMNGAQAIVGTHSGGTEYPAQLNLFGPSASTAINFCTAGPAWGSPASVGAVSGSGAFIWGTTPYFYLYQSGGYLVGNSFGIANGIPLNWYNSSVGLSDTVSSLTGDAYGQLVFAGTNFWLHSGLSVSSNAYVTNGLYVGGSARIAGGINSTGGGITNNVLGFFGSLTGSLAGANNLPLSGLQAGGAASGQFLTYNGAAWVPGNAPTGSGGGGAQSPLTNNVNGANYGITNLLDIILGNIFTLTANGFTNTASGSTAYLFGGNSSVNASNIVSTTLTAGSITGASSGNSVFGSVTGGLTLAPANGLTTNLGTLYSTNIVTTMSGFGASQIAVYNCATNTPTNSWGDFTAGPIRVASSAGVLVMTNSWLYIPGAGTNEAVAVTFTPFLSANGTTLLESWANPYTIVFTNFAGTTGFTAPTNALSLILGAAGWTALGYQTGTTGWSVYLTNSSAAASRFTAKGSFQNL